MTFGTATCHYGDWLSLIRNLNSTSDYFDKRIIINGPFKGFKGRNFPVPRIFPLYSNLEVVNTEGLDLTEADSRNLYLAFADMLEINWLLILDSDEYITVQDWNQFKHNAVSNLESRHNVYGIKSKDEYNDYSYSFRPRLWYKPWEMIYEGCHWCFHRKDGREIKTMAANIEGITIEHDKKLRSKEYADNWKEFREYQKATEETNV